jgi:hypothetical protein
MQTIDDVIAEGMGTSPRQPLSRRQVIPYGDLSALDQPIQLAQIGDALVPTLAIGVAQGKDAPKLLSADGQGRLVTSANINTLARFAAPFTGGSTVAQVDDTSAFYPGQIVAFVSATGGVAACGGVTLEQIIDSTHFRFFSTCVGQNFAAGDYIVGKGSVNIDPTATTLTVQGTVSIGNFPADTRITGPLLAVAPGAPLPGDTDVGNTNTVNGRRRLMVDSERSYDWQGLAPRQTGGSITVTETAQGVGFRNVVSLLLFSLSSNVAGDFATCELWLDAAGTGQKLVDEIIQIATATSAQVLNLIGVRFKGNDNKAVVGRMVSGGTAPSIAMTMAGYIEE